MVGPLGLACVKEPVQLPLGTQPDMWMPQATNSSSLGGLLIMKQTEQTQQSTRARYGYGGLPKLPSYGTTGPPERIDWP